MELAHRWSDRNLTRIELVMALLLLSVMIGYFSHYMYSVFGKVEKNMIERTVININTALHYHTSFALMNNDVFLLKELEKLNPMELMTNASVLENFTYNRQINNTIDLSYIMVAPSNYGGEVIDDSESSLEPGKWYYDKDEYFIFYLIKNDEFYFSELDGPARVRYKLSLRYTDMNNDGEYSPLEDEFDSLKLQAIDTSDWTFNQR